MFSNTRESRTLVTRHPRSGDRPLSPHLAGCTPGREQGVLPLVCRWSQGVSLEELSTQAVSLTAHSGPGLPRTTAVTQRRVASGKAWQPSAGQSRGGHVREHLRASCHASLPLCRRVCVCVCVWQCVLEWKKLQEGRFAGSLKGPGEVLGAQEEVSAWSKRPSPVEIPQSRGVLLFLRGCKSIQTALCATR